MDDPQNWGLAGLAFVVFVIVVASIVLMGVYLLGKWAYKLIRWLLK